MDSTLNGLVYSRKFWIAVGDMLISIILYFVGRFFPAAVEDVKFLIVAIQPVAVILIYAIAHEDVADKMLEASRPQQDSTDYEKQLIH